MRQSLLGQPEIGRVRLVQIGQVLHVVGDGNHQFLPLLYHRVLVGYGLPHLSDQLLVSSSQLQETRVHVHSVEQLIHLIGV